MELVTVKELEVINENEGIELKKTFMPFFEEAEQIKIEAEKIKIISIDQKEDMKKAREMRLKLKNIRINAEKTRKELKEESLRKGKAIDGIANVIKYLVEPIENYLEGQEKFIENLEKQRKIELKNKRISELIQFNISDFEQYNLDEMPEDVYISFFESKKKNYFDFIEAEKKSEKERIEKEKKEAAEREQIRLENEKLKKESAEREQIRLENEKLKKEAAELENEKKQKERIEKERIEKENEIKIKQEKEKIELEQKEKQKGEKEKFIDFCNKLELLTLPDVKSEKGIAVNKSIKNVIDNLIINIKNNI